ncbi:hypothetical protein BJ912DRAFT_1024344 [Pholiota molesta]|nr:hypothetical protein BJ912DRAFT_1024344 [Pholiota molesta]
MPAKKRPQIIMEVLTKSKPANLKQAMKPPMAETVQRVERHISYDVSGESSSSFIPVPPSPPRSFHPVQNPTTSPSVPSSSFFPPTEDDIERVDDETRLLEVEGLGSLSANLSTQDNPLLLWVPYIDRYVEELLRLEGRGDSSDADSCASSNCLSAPMYRCTDCQDARMFCSACIVAHHQSLPYHRIQFWNGSFFEKTTLRSLGLHVQLGHVVGTSCPVPVIPHNDEFTVIDCDGVHQITLRFCGCLHSVHHTAQLLRARLFPSTTTDPRSAATFRVLETFQMLSFNSKVSAFEFYKALEARTDNTGTNFPPDRYHVFLRIVREWRHVRLLKRMGRGHSSSGVKGTKEGECAVLCPACPLPDINLPPDWKTRPQSDQWLYTLFVAIDANFRLKRLNVSNHQRDPGLNHGYAYVVEETRFKDYLSKFDTRVGQEKSLCVDHDAIKAASKRGGEGWQCGRHDMKRANGVGDLQKGERYVNMDYFLLSSLKINTPPQLVVSYDIACQWSRNLEKRVQIYPPNPLSDGQMNLTTLVPKFHLPAHVLECQTSFSFNLVPGVGRTDGEAPERGWSEINAVATSTKEMGPGSRRDTLDDHFGARNWRKITQIAPTFVRKTTEALAGREESVAAFLEFDAALSIKVNDGLDHSVAPTDEWTALCLNWEVDRARNPNPFQVNEIGITVINEKEVRLRLAQEDAAAISKGEFTAIHDAISPSLLIYQGLEIEDLQRKLVVDSAELGSHSTDLQRAKIVERCNYLRRKFEAWCEIQNLYMPEVAALRAHATSDGGGSLAIEDIQLYLPSSVIDSVACNPRLIEAEWQLRYAMADSTLNTLRSHLLLRTRLYKSKDKDSRGQAMNTRSQSLIKNVEHRVRASVVKYRYVRRAMSALATFRKESDTWKNTFKELKDEHGRRHRLLSWIWKVHGAGDGIDEGTQDALRIEWCRARARAHRWQEECLLLAEEMRRVLAYFSWQANWWTELSLDPPMIKSKSTISGKHPANIRVIDGKRAYALRQADIQQKMHDFCQLKWSGLSERLLTMDGRDAKVMVEIV